MKPTADVPVTDEKTLAELTPEQAAFIDALQRFNGTRGMQRSPAQRVARKATARNLGKRAKELFPGIPVEIV